MHSELGPARALPVAVAAAACLYIWLYGSYKSSKSIQNDVLPASLSEWQASSSKERRESIWNPLRPTFERHGIRLWSHEDSNAIRKPDTGYPTNSSFLFVGPRLFSEHSGEQVRRITLLNGHLTAGTNREGVAVVIRAICRREEGKQHLRMMRRVATGLESLVSTNHMLPVWNEIVHDGVIFTVSPMVGPSVQNAMEWEGTSTGDALDMILQALEGLSYLHSIHIVHRDAFIHNFLVQWLPESLIHGKPSITHPRVYIIDLECALELGPNCAEDDYIVYGPPIKDRPYKMPTPPEASARAYNALHADIWQFGWSLRHFSSMVSEIDDVLRRMSLEEPSQRPSSHKAHEQLQTALFRMPPNRLHTRPVIHRLVDENISHLFQVWGNDGKASVG